MKKEKKGDIEISKLIGLIIAVIALILIITFIYLNWKPLKEALGKIGENVLGQTKDIMEIDKKQFLDQTITTQDEQLDKTIKDIDKLDCTSKPDAAVARWKQAISLISNSKYKGQHKGEEPELQYKIINCYKQVENCEKVTEEFRTLRDKIQSKDAFDYTSKACVEFYECLNEGDKQKCSQKVLQQGKPIEKEQIEERLRRAEAETLVKFNTKYKEAIDNFNSKRYKRAEDIAGDLADAIYGLLPKGGAPGETCDDISSKYNVEKGLCLQRDKLYLSSRYVEIFSKFRATNNCEEMESDYINDFSGNILFLKDETSDLKYIRFIKGTNVGASDLSGKPIVSQALYDLGKCFEQRRDEQKIREHFNALLVSYPNEKIAETLIKEKEPKCDNYYSDASVCNNINLWLKITDPRIGTSIKQKLKCWHESVTFFGSPGFFGRNCNSCVSIKSCAEYKSEKEACTIDPCGFGCKEVATRWETTKSGAKCVPS